METGVKKKLRPGLIEAAPDECAIIVHYDTETQYLGDAGEVIKVERKPNVKRIRVKALRAGTNTEVLAQEIIDKCRLISQSKLGMVERLLQQLQKRGGEGDEGEMNFSTSEPIKEPVAIRRHSIAGVVDTSMFDRETTTATEDVADPDKIDEYLESLYDELPQKEHSTKMISRLASHPGTVEVILSQPSILGALSRVLREEGRKSTALSFNIVYTFFCLSHFSDFHKLISEQQLGDLTMRILDLELKRSDARSQEGNEKEVARAERKITMGEDLGDKLKKVLLTMRRQDNLLYISTYLLLNLAEDVAIERKMRRRGITVYLIKLLERRNVELLILVVTFLKKLSIYKENIQKMAECNIIGKLSPFIPSTNDVLLVSTLRLLHNLSFSAELRDQMVKAGLVPRLVEMMKVSTYQALVMGILYHISMEDKFKSVFTYTDAVPFILDLILGTDDLHGSPELISLAVNLTQNQRNAEIMCEGDNFNSLMRRACNYHDNLAFKLLRNLSQQDLQIKMLFKDHIDDLIVLMKAPDTSPDLLVEILGTLGNLTISQMDFGELIQSHDLLYFLSMHIQPGVVEDDIILEVVIFIGTLCDSIETSTMIVDAGLVNKLYHLMSDKKEDDEMVLQVTFTFARLLQFEPTREALLCHTQVVYYFVDLLHDQNKEVRKTSGTALDTIMDHDEEWAIRIRRLKFESYNQEWLAATEESHQAAEAENASYEHIDGVYGHEHWEEEEPSMHHDDSFTQYDRMDSPMLSPGLSP